MLFLSIIQMPEMDGLEASRAIHQRWLKEQQPWIIAITAYALKGDRERCIAAGMENYLAKPVKKEELREALSRCCSKESQPRSSGAAETISK
jgi:CheY-like chemotaxis protein